jgi:hypothetical protein
MLRTKMQKPAPERSAAMLHLRRPKKAKSKSDAISIPGAKRSRNRERNLLRFAISVLEANSVAFGLSQ